jgi:hypothetical protein
LRRYLLMLVLNLVTSDDDDDDGNGARRDQQSQVYSRRDEINQSVPMNDKSAERTPAAFLDALEIAMRSCGTLDAVNKLIAGVRVQGAMREFKNGDKARLDGIIASGIGAHGRTMHEEEVEDDGSAADEPADKPRPGPGPDQMRRERETADANA